MALPPWAVNAIRRGIVDVARKAGDAETISKLKEQATEILRDLPEGAAKSVDAIVRSAKAGKESLQRWVDRQSEICVPLINASGVLLHDDFGNGLPIDDSVLQIGCDILRGDVSHRDRRQRIQSRLNACVPEQSVAVANSLDAAVASLPWLAGDHGVVVHRNQAIRLPSGTPLPDAIGQDHVLEVGGSEEVTDSDFDSVTESLILLADSGQDSFSIPKRPEPSGPLAVVLSVATVTEQYESVRSAKSVLCAGADLVVMPGNGLCGGPECGVIIGGDQWVTKLVQNKRWSALGANDAIAAMMVVALEQSEDKEVSSDIDALMNANVENLRSRAERLATRLGAVESIGSCQITDEPARLNRLGRWTFPSRQLRLRHASKSAADWASDLADAETAVAVKVDGDDIVVDLRWVRASDDARLAEQFER